ncbi:hypothetical protein ACFRH6_24415 [Streptomyces sp. NPDC056749]
MTAGFQGVCAIMYLTARHLIAGPAVRFASPVERPELLGVAP